MNANFTSLGRAALDIVRESGQIICQNIARPHTIRHKGTIDLVTETDLAVEDFLTSRLARLTPDVPFLAEESHQSRVAPDTCWIIDPVDGTTNFAHGLPLTATSVALQQEGRVVLGIVNVPLINECFVAEAGRGAWLNERPIKVSTVAACHEALVATGFPYTIAERVDDILEKLRPVLTATQGIRRCGAAALDLAWVAAGRFDAYYEADLNPWDVAAGSLLITEAGGCLSDMDGGPFTLLSTVLATNGLMHPLMLDLLRKQPGCTGGMV